MVWKEGLLIKEFPPESYTIKNIDDAWAFLATEDGQLRFNYETGLIMIIMIILIFIDLKST